MRRVWHPFPTTLVLVGILLLAATSFAQGPSGDQPANGPRPVVRTATRSDLSAPVRQMPELPPKPAVLGQIFERPIKRLPNRLGSTPPPDVSDPVLQPPTSGSTSVTTGTNFEGLYNVSGALPPDTVGAIGPNHYVQMVNLAFAVFDRSDNQMHGPYDNNSLWQGFGGPCETRNDGDPVVLYDHLADRFLMSQLAVPNFPRGPFYQCIAVSQTGDPLGSWHRYEFLISKNKLNDYPKFGVWPDGYYMSMNQYSCRLIGCSWGGQGAVAFERDKMLNGQQAQMVYFDLHNTDSTLGGMLPSDLDGPPPPAGAPNHFAQIDDDAWGYSPDQVQIWDFHVDWSNPSSSTFTKWGALQTADFDSNLCDYARNCIPQPTSNSVNVDALSDRLMYRLQYRNFPNAQTPHETLMLNHTVDVDESDHAGIRWYELRNAGSGWSIYQQSTFAPDNDHRWMGSIAMNGAGDVGLGYSVSSIDTFPSIRATGRLWDDDPNQMTQGEVTIADGTYYQVHDSGRWGDYSSMTVDPVDDCTFWYTQEYYDPFWPYSENLWTVDLLALWQTRIGSFKLRDCGALPSPPVAPTNLQASVVSSSEIDLTWNDNSNDEDGFRVKRCEGAGCTPTSAVATLGAGATSYNNTGLAANTTYEYLVVAYIGSVESGPSNQVSGTTDQVLPPDAPSGLQATATSSSQINLTWADNSSDEDEFRIKRCTNTGGGCTPTTVVATVGAGMTSYSDTGLSASTTYEYLVVAYNAGGESGPSNQASDTTQAGPAILLSVSGTKDRGFKTAHLEWTGASLSVNVYRDGAQVATSVSGPTYDDEIGRGGGSTFTYQVCVSNGPCSNEAVITF